MILNDKLLYLYSLCPYLMVDQYDNYQEIKNTISPYDCAFIRYAMSLTDDFRITTGAMRSIISMEINRRGMLDTSKVPLLNNVTYTKTKRKSLLPTSLISKIVNNIYEKFIIHSADILYTGKTFTLDISNDLKYKKVIPLITNDSAYVLCNYQNESSWRKLVDNHELYIKILSTAEIVRQKALLSVKNVTVINMPTFNPPKNGVTKYSIDSKILDSNIFFSMVFGASYLYPIYDHCTKCERRFKCKYVK